MYKLGKIYVISESFFIFVLINIEWLNKMKKLIIILFCAMNTSAYGQFSHSLFMKDVVDWQAEGFTCSDDILQLTDRSFLIGGAWVSFSDSRRVLLSSSGMVWAHSIRLNPDHTYFSGSQGIGLAPKTLNGVEGTYSIDPQRGILTLSSIYEVESKNYTKPDSLRRVDIKPGKQESTRYTVKHYMRERIVKKQYGTMGDHGTIREEVLIFNHLSDQTQRGDKINVLNGVYIRTRFTPDDKKQ